MTGDKKSFLSIKPDLSTPDVEVAVISRIIFLNSTLVSSIDRLMRFLKITPPLEGSWRFTEESPGNWLWRLSFFRAALGLKGPEAVPGEFVVKLKTNLNKSILQQANLSALGRALGSTIKSTIADDNIVVVKRAVVELSHNAIKELSANPLVELAEPNFIYRAEKNPNDPFLEKLWGLRNIGQTDTKGAGTAGVDIDALRAWDISQGSEDTIIAVIDTGIDYTHPDLKENIWVNEVEAHGKPGVDDDGNGYIDDIYGVNVVDSVNLTADPKDDHGHGSHCSGTIGGRGDDSKGIVGVNWRVKLMAVKFLSGDGSGSLEGAIRAIDYATKMNAKIMSNGAVVANHRP